MYHEIHHEQNTPPSSPSAKGVFEQIPSKISFYAGFAAGIMGIATLGFVFVFFGGWSKLPKADLTVKTAEATGVDEDVAALDDFPSADPDVALEKMPPVTNSDHVRGDLDKAKVVLVEYSDFECPFCKQFHPTLQKIYKDYNGAVAWVYRDFPLSFHQNAQKEAEATECAAELGGNKAFWAFTDKIFERTTSNGTGLALSALGPLAKEIGLDQNKFQSCLDSGKYAQAVRDELAGGEAAGINGTPGTIVITKDGPPRLISGAQSEDVVRAVIDPFLK